MNPYRAALLACTAIRSGLVLIPRSTGFASVPMAYPWPGVIIRRWAPVKMDGPVNGTSVFFEEPA